MKKVLFLLSMVTALSSFSSCYVGYVSEEPTYVETNRPSRPSEHHVWIEGDWIWNSKNNNYKRNDSHWTLPEQGRSYNQGHWKKDRHGYQWVSGSWRK